MSSQSNNENNKQTRTLQVTGPNPWFKIAGFSNKDCLHFPMPRNHFKSGRHLGNTGETAKKLRVLLEAAWPSGWGQWMRSENCFLSKLPLTFFSQSIFPNIPWLPIKRCSACPPPFVFNWSWRTRDIGAQVRFLSPVYWDNLKPLRTRIPRCCHENATDIKSKPGPYFLSGLTGG